MEIKIFLVETFSVIDIIFASKIRSQSSYAARLFSANFKAASVHQLWCIVELNSTFV